MSIGQKKTYFFSTQAQNSTKFPHLQDLNDMILKNFEVDKVKSVTLIEYLQKIGQQVGEQQQSSSSNDLNILLNYGKQVISLCMANDTSRGDYYMVEFYKIIIQSIEKGFQTCSDPQEIGILQGKYFMTLVTLATIYFNQGYLDHCFDCTKKLLELYDGQRKNTNQNMTFISDNVFFMNGDQSKENFEQSQEIEFFYCDKASVLFQQLQNYPTAQRFSDQALEIAQNLKNKPGSFYFNAFNQNISLILLSGENEQVIARYLNLVQKFDYNKIKDSKGLLDKYSLRLIQAMQISMNFFNEKFNLFWEHYKKFQTETKYKQKRDEILRLHYTHIHNNNPTFFQDKQDLVDRFIAKYEDLFLQKFKDIFFVPLQQKQQPLYDYCMFIQQTETSYKQGLQQTLYHLNMLKDSNNKEAIKPEFEQMFYKNIKVYIQLDYFIDQFAKDILSINDLESEPLQVKSQISFMSPEIQDKINKLLVKYDRKIV